jgi:hypothetical protein
MSSPIFDATFGTGRFKSEEPMTADQSQATPADELRRQIMDPNIPKSEREWWAAHEIKRLRNDQPKGGDAALYPSIKDDQTIPRQLGPGDSAKSPGPQDVRERLEQTALAIHKARFAHPEHPREPDPFTDEGDREYCFRLARAALAQSDAEPAASAELIEAAKWLGTAASRFEEAADALRSEYKTYARQMDRWAGDTRERARLFRIFSRAADSPDASGLIKALERISKSDVYDMDTLHPDRCASVAAEALKAFRAADRSVHGELIPDCPTDGVAARQGNGG